MIEFYKFFNNNYKIFVMKDEVVFYSETKYIVELFFRIMAAKCVCHNLLISVHQ